MAASSSTMAFVVHRCALLVGFLLLITQWSHIAAEVVSLTDQTFEHQTQASTGMTTGSWLVLFSIPDCPSCESLKPVIEDLGKDEEVYERWSANARVPHDKDVELYTDSRCAIKRRGRILRNG